MEPLRGLGPLIPVCSIALSRAEGSEKLEAHPLYVSLSYSTLKRSLSLVFHLLLLHRHNFGERRI